MKMLCGYAIVTTTLVVFVGTTVASPPRTMKIVYDEDLNNGFLKDATTTSTVDDDRSFNSKYVTVLQGSSIWSDIKRRTLARPRVAEIADKSPAELSDQELAELKRACHDGLKCVAVDQLLVLNTGAEPKYDGRSSVHTAITKITRVITNYTNEYHQEFEYEEVNETDVPAKVFESVTSIVEDNKELCQTEFGPGRSRSKTDDAPRHVVYNINNGTVNNTTVNVPLSDYTGDPASGDDAADNDTQDFRIVFAVDNGSTDNGTSSTTGGNRFSGIGIDGGPKRKNAVTNVDASVNTDDLAVINITTAPDGTYVIDASNYNTFKFPDTDVAENVYATRRGAVDANPMNTTKFGNKQVVYKNINQRNAGRNVHDGDMVVSGTFDQSTAANNRHVEEDGIFNDGDTGMYNTRNGAVNTGVVDDGNVGIVNARPVKKRGPINYGTTTNNNNRVNNGKGVESNDLNINQLAINLDEIYSNILRRFAEHF